MDKVNIELKSFINIDGIAKPQQQQILEKLSKIQHIETNIMVVGEFGCGKSSTINGLLNANVAAIGETGDLQTLNVQPYKLGNLILWDTPGFGVDTQTDQKNAAVISAKLKEKNESGKPLIDLVLFIVDASIRDYGTSFDVINNIIIPAIGDKSKILIVANQADMAMKGRNWNHEENQPNPELLNFLQEKVISIKQRFKESTGIEIDPIYYSVAAKEGSCNYNHAYNIPVLFNYIIQHIVEPELTVQPILEPDPIISSQPTSESAQKIIKEGIFAKLINFFKRIFNR